MAKYHISPKTGRPNICRATVKPCPLGSEEPHFSSKEEANDHIQESLKKEYYAFKTVSKKDDSIVVLAALSVMADEEEDNSSYYADHFLSSKFEDLGWDTSEISFDTIEHPDYMNSTLMEKDGQHFLIETSGGEWVGFQVYDYSNVIPVSKEQIKSKTTKWISDTKDYPELNNSLKELKELSSKDGDTTPFANTTTKVEPFIFISNRSKTYTRSDGSEIKCFSIAPPGDRSFTDEPYPVEINVDFDENGERQNARMMDEGYCIYDTRINQGIVLKARTGSEGADQSNQFELRKNGLFPKASNYTSELGEMYFIEGDGLTSKEYYKKV